MARTGVALDGTPQSLPLLDRHIQRLYRAARNDEERKTLLFLWGSYFGEVVREELAGAQWKFSDKSLLDCSLDWDIGDVELHLWPFSHVQEFATGKTKKTLHELWEETERAYVDFSLAAKYAE